MSAPSHRRSLFRGALAAGSALLLAGCGLLGSAPPAPVAGEAAGRGKNSDREAASDKAYDVVLFALGLVETGYRFGGKNPEAGLDCSGMVSYVFDKAAGVRVSGSAADIAKLGRVVERERLQPGDLVFFNTLGYSFSHVGIYIGDGRFVHAPRSNAKVRVDRLTDRYFAQRFEAARTYFD